MSGIGSNGLVPASNATVGKYAAFLNLKRGELIVARGIKDRNSRFGCRAEERGGMADGTEERW